MRLLGIQASDYQMYEDMFLKCREWQYFLTRTDGRWREVKHRWNKNDVLRHLNGEKTIGLFPATWINYLMIDIDRHNDEDDGVIKSRINQVTEAIGGNPLMYQSSSSRGMRLCFFLPEPVARDVLYRGCKGLFQQNGLVVQPGSVEIMATIKGDRLPFGDGSYLVDPFDLEPIYHLTLQQTITEAFKVFQYQKVDIPFNVHQQAGILVPDWGGTGAFNQVVSRLLDEGLYPEINTNEALLKLSYDLIIRKGYSKEETERYLVNWIREKHNGCSTRVNQSKIENVFEQIERIVERTDPGKAKYRGSRFAVREKKLSVGDVRKIISLTDDRKLQLALFSLLEYCLNFGKIHSGKTATSNKISNLYRSEKGYVTYRSGFQTNFYCEISKKTLQHLNGFDKANPQTTMQQIERLNVVSLKRRAHRQSHHCRQYWVDFTFDEEDSIKVVSLEEGLVKLTKKK